MFKIASTLSITLCDYLPLTNCELHDIYTVIGIALLLALKYWEKFWNNFDASYKKRPLGDTTPTLHHGELT